MKQEDFDDLKRLVDFLMEKRIAEFDLHRGDLKIRLKFGPPVFNTVILPPNPKVRTESTVPTAPPEG